MLQCYKCTAIFITNSNAEWGSLYWVKISYYFIRLIIIVLNFYKCNQKKIDSIDYFFFVRKGKLYMSKL